MNFNGFELLNELSFIGLTILFGLIIILAWISTKVECDFRHVRTIIFQANNQRIPNYEHVTQSNLIPIDEINSLNRLQNNYNIAPTTETNSLNENQILRDNFTNITFEDKGIFSLNLNHY